jgi:hypothetical protein
MINWDEFKWEDYTEFQQALKAHLLRRNMRLDADFVFEFGIDCVFVYVEDKPVFIVNLPPMSNYSVDETEYTDRYMWAEERELIAV